MPVGRGLHPHFVRVPALRGRRATRALPTTHHVRDFPRRHQDTNGSFIFRRSWEEKKWRSLGSFGLGADATPESSLNPCGNPPGHKSLPPETGPGYNPHTLQASGSVEPVLSSRLAPVAEVWVELRWLTGFSVATVGHRFRTCLPVGIRRSPGHALSAAQSSPGKTANCQKEFRPGVVRPHTSVPILMPCSPPR